MKTHCIALPFNPRVIKPICPRIGPMKDKCLGVKLPFSIARFCVNTHSPTEPGGGIFWDIPAVTTPLLFRAKFLAY